ncbi:phosphatidylserine/phosphatidylglycerophosphate/cardiolipin synthase family protein [Kutzneria buriramensis]|uniref:phospholipase D-like domain-containing protein n=1 Tax=Kutzneria buriramensis TaxID=1045776 RepID=UPI0035E9C39F
MTLPSAADSPLTLVTQPQQGYTAIYNLVNNAQKTIDLTMYELTDTTAENDLVAAAARGVTVRVVLDTNRERTHNQSAFTLLSGKGVHVVWANTKYAATHQKTLTVDGVTSAIMTGNLTSQYYATSRDFAVIDTTATDVTAIEKVFNADYAHTSITPGDGADLVWSPTDSEPQLLALINGATASLQVENEEMGLPAVTTALQNAAKRGVSVQVIMTNTANDYATEFDALTAAGAKVSTYAADAPLYIHAKAIVADYGRSGAKVFLGSENFSSASLTENRELGLITTDSAVMSSVHSTLASDYAGGTLWS